FQKDWDGQSPYAIVTVVETIGLTAAKPGSRAIVTHNGETVGFVGGGCVRGALKKAAADCIADGRSRLITARPRDLVGPVNLANGVYPSSCPSGGEIKLFIEPVRPSPPLYIIGETEIAHWVAQLAPVAGFSPRHIEEKPSAGSLPDTAAFIVIATQGVA